MNMPKVVRRSYTVRLDRRELNAVMRTMRKVCRSENGRRYGSRSERAALAILSQAYATTSAAPIRRGSSIVTEDLQSQLGFEVYVDVRERLVVHRTCRRGSTFVPEPTPALVVERKDVAVLAATISALQPPAQSASRRRRRSQ